MTNFASNSWDISILTRLLQFFCQKLVFLRKNKWQKCDETKWNCTRVSKKKWNSTKRHKRVKYGKIKILAAEIFTMKWNSRQKKPRHVKKYWMSFTNVGFYSKFSVTNSEFHRNENQKNVIFPLPKITAYTAVSHLP